MPLYFLHIPKTAGTSMSDYIDSHYERSNIALVQLWRTLLIEKIKLENYGLIRGHFGYNIGGLIKNDFGIERFTMLRSPLDRVESQINHLIQDGLEGNWMDTKSVDEIFNDSEKISLLANTQVKHIGIDLKVQEIVEKNNIEPIYFDKLLDKFGDYSSKFLDVSKTRLSNMLCFGLKERFQESLFLLSYAKKWKPVFFNKKLQVWPRKYSIKKKERTLLLKKNKDDF